MSDRPEPGSSRSWRERLREEWQAVRSRLREVGLAGVVGDVYGLVGKNRLLTYASAIAYQVLFALIPLALAVLAVLGYLNLTEIWSDQVAPRIESRLSGAGYEVVNETVQRILTSKRAFWLTLGAALALWEVSGAVRAVMGALDDMYGTAEQRPFLRQMAVSIGLSVPVAILLLTAGAAAQLAAPIARWRGAGGSIVGVLEAAGWVIAVVLLVLAVWLLLRFAPSSPRQPALVSLSSIFVVALWLAASAIFGVYATSIASYGSIFGGMAVAIVLMTYLYVSAIVFLVAVQIDAYVQSLARHGSRTP